MVAPRRTAIVLAEQAAALQDRHHRVDEDLEPGRQYIRVCTDNLNAGVAVMKSAKDGA
jgi:hypothetical protein